MSFGVLGHQCGHGLGQSSRQLILDTHNAIREAVPQNILICGETRTGIEV